MALSCCNITLDELWDDGHRECDTILMRHMMEFKCLEEAEVRVG